MSTAIVWHDLECGGYSADLPLWRELAAEADGPVLDVGAGTGRVALDLARRGHAVTALDSDAELLATLRDRAGELPVGTVCADARTFALERRFALILVPMQTVQILGGAAGRTAFLERARAHLEPGGRLAAALAVELEAVEPEEAAFPLPDLREIDGVVYASQPVAVRPRAGQWVIERVREVVALDGRRTVTHDEVRLDGLAPEELAEEAWRAGLELEEVRRIGETEEHVASEVVIVRG
jgi:SAM-dependent methyltransferase